MVLKITDRKLQAETGDQVDHGFFGKTGGVSKGIYNGLNCGPGSYDDPEAVAENRKLVAELMGVAPENLLTLHQVHSNICLAVDEPWPEGLRPEADAMVTDVPGLALGVLTADCAPVLFCGKKEDGSPVIGAAHAGWGGALGGILEATVEKMKARGAKAETIRATIGPAICVQSYEVGDEFVQKFLRHDSENERFFTASVNDGHMMFDLPSYVEQRLRKAGVSQVSDKAVDTYFNEEDFFSFRRSTHRSEPDYGRQISVIVIRIHQEQPLQRVEAYN